MKGFLLAFFLTTTSALDPCDEIVQIVQAGYGFSPFEAGLFYSYYPGGMSIATVEACIAAPSSPLGKAANVIYVPFAFGFKLGSDLYDAAQPKSG